MSAAAKTIADLIQDRFGLPSTAGAALPAEGTVAQLLAHRTHRRYTADPVPDDVLNVALAAALSAPSKSDLQQVAVVLVNDRAKQATIGGWIPDMPFIATAPRFLVFCGDHRRLRRIFELRGRPFANDTLDMFMNAAVDAGLVLQAFVTAAEGLGLGCCPISVVRNHVEKLSELLELPSGVFPVAGHVRRLSEPGGLDQHAAAARRSPCTSTATTTATCPPSSRTTTVGARAATPRPRRASASSSASATPSPTAGRRTRPGSTPSPSATTSARTSAATASAWPERSVSRKEPR